MGHWSLIMAASRCLVSGNSVLRAAPCFLRLRPPLLAQSRGRKSRSDPPAKSKAGRIKLPPPVDPEELVVVQGRYLQYKGMMAALREERYAQEQEQEKQRQLQATISREAKHFVTLENLDQRIEEALDNPKNLNFAVDKEGRVAKRTALQ